MKQYIMTVEENKEIAKNIFNLIIDARDMIPIPLPGQYLHIRVNDSFEPLLRRPISIHDYDNLTKKISIIYRVVGQGTNILCKKKFGDSIDIFGPLGNGFSYEDFDCKKKVVLIGGGIGSPPLYYLAKELAKKGNDVTTILGYQSHEDSILVNEFSSLGDVRVSTIDGSFGTKGTVIDLISEKDKWDVFYSCGPMGMMKAIQEKWYNTDIIGYLSLEERMGCGVGACYGCIVKVDKSIHKEGYKKVCSDGPVFPFREVII